MKALKRMNRLWRSSVTQRYSDGDEEFLIDGVQTEILEPYLPWENTTNIHSRNYWSERTFLEKILIILLVVAIGVGIVLSISLASNKSGLFSSHHMWESTLVVQKKEGHAHPSTPDAHAGICETPECVTAAAYLISSMDTSVDPCEDFFTFSCGGYLNKTFLLGGKVSRFSKLSVNILLRIKVLLEEPHHEDDPMHWNKTKEFYKECMNLALRQSVKSRPLENDLEKLGEWPLMENGKWNGTKFSWNEILKKMFELGYDKDILLNIDVDVDLKNNTKTILMVDQPTLTMPRILYLLKDPYDYGLKAYKLFIIKCAIMMKPSASIKEIEEQVDDAVDIEIKLAKASLAESERQNFIQLYENRTMTYKELKEKYEAIPWADLFRSFLPEHVILTDNDVIWVPVPSAISELEEIVKNDDVESKRKLANYMMYRVVLKAARDLNHAFAQASYDFGNSLTGRPFSYPEPWQECVHTTKDIFSHSLSSMYIKKYFQEKTKQNVSVVELSIKDMLEEQIKDAEWIDDETQDRALSKAEKIEATIGYPEEIMNHTVLDNFFENLQVDKNHYENVREAHKFYSILEMEGLHEKYDKRSWRSKGDLLVANAFYSPTRNAIVIPVGVLQDETYNEEEPNYLNFGSLGMLLGHELTHGFDMTGNQFNGKGDLEFWWTGETYDKIKERSQCFIKQYNNYEVPELGEKLNGTLTLNENMADTGGLYIAYKAYQRWVERNGKEKLLPGIPYTPNQLFWLSFATVWCDKETADHLRYSIMHDEHSPAPYRVKGVVSNLKEFSTDFNCKKEATMNPETKCLLWT